MGYPLITSCPVCSQQLKITKLQCHHCHTTIENDFELTNWAALTSEQLNFIGIFLKSRGNIKEVEKELGISYPTVRGKLNDVISALGYSEKEEAKNKTEEKNVITMLENGEITADEALRLLKDK
ncbi:DUF2089 domain-containing protein [Lederbergia galactosidilytica]|uniref:DUF2089 domain-containing protein n=1 Tax=Lederbergia galactosidilytica TaxID=217031 RepID=A0A178A1Q1_9BACI|nr:DUF2089 domain-containing protein [Lederbergia galactosidilytica]KRG14927.1 hypothetical protein ACA30_09710 [Virgibacillus soli]OAK73843.1 hypothetical protein ABB05_05240 [Lederbergia galactosidilytica]